MIYADAADVAGAREKHTSRASRRSSASSTTGSPGSDWREVADGLIWSNFFLAYQGENDTSLQARYAALAARALDSVDRAWREPMPVRSVAGRKIRIGFVSALLRECTVGRYFSRWLTDLDRDEFEVVFYSLSSTIDEVTTAIGARADRVHTFGGGEALPSTIAPLVRSDQLDMLVYPELGMDQATFALASMRLAPRQYAAWGHPVTTGHATIDGYLSCAAMEPADADRHYTEKLVRLPGIGTRFQRQTLPPPIEREAFSLPRDATLLLCPQSLFKIHPDNDALFARVLAANPAAVLVLFAGRHPVITDQFMRRLARCFEEHGLSIRERTRVLPHLGHDDYLAVNLVCDAMLDTMRWSGGQTSVDALACGLPVVTLPGSMMRGRQSAGMLGLLGLGELIAADADDYVSIATRLCQDGAWRKMLAAQDTGAQQPAVRGWSAACCAGGLLSRGCLGSRQVVPPDAQETVLEVPRVSRHVEQRRRRVGCARGGHERPRAHGDPKRVAKPRPHTSPKDDVTISGSPMARSWLPGLRLASVSPAYVTTGTPTSSASLVVVCAP